MAVVYSYNTYFLYTNIFKFFGTTCPCCSRSCPFILYAPALLGVWHFLASTANISANFAKYRHLKKIYGFSPFSCKRTIFICFLATFFCKYFPFCVIFFWLFFFVFHSSVANAKIHKSPKTSSFQPYHDPKPQLFTFANQNY